MQSAGLLPFPISFHTFHLSNSVAMQCDHNFCTLHWKFTIQCRNSTQSFGMSMFLLSALDFIWLDPKIYGYLILLYMLCNFHALIDDSWSNTLGEKAYSLFLLFLHLLFRYLWVCLFWPHLLWMHIKAPISLFQLPCFLSCIKSTFPCQNLFNSDPYTDILNPTVP